VAARAGAGLESVSSSDSLAALTNQIKSLASQVKTLTKEVKSLKEKAPAHYNEF
jgi:hypothetical protein